MLAMSATLIAMSQAPLDGAHAMAARLNATVGCAAETTCLVGHGVLRPHWMRALRQAVRTSTSRVQVVSVDREALADGYDMLVFDLSARAHSGIDVATLRRRFDRSWLCCVGARNEREAIRLLGAGADETILVGSSCALAAARLGAAVRRIERRAFQRRVALGDLVCDREARRLTCGGREIPLTPREWQLFDYLVARTDDVASVQELRKEVFHADPALESNAVAVFIGYLRRKLAVSQRARIVTVPGRGYALTAVPADERAGSEHQPAL